jgi:hypothetical protein
MGGFFLLAQDQSPRLVRAFASAMDAVCGIEPAGLLPIQHLTI